MKLIPKANELISNMRSFFQANNPNKGYLNEEPLRSELFSSDQMESHSKSLATTHKLTKKRTPDISVEAHIPGSLLAPCVPIS